MRTDASLSRAAHGHFLLPTRHPADDEPVCQVLHEYVPSVQVADRLQPLPRAFLAMTPPADIKCHTPPRRKPARSCLQRSTWAPWGPAPKAARSCCPGCRPGAAHQVPGGARPGLHREMPGRHLLEWRDPVSAARTCN